MSHSTDADNAELTPANTEKTYHVTRKDLPLSCPTPEMALWNSHPRVYLPIEKSGRETCPYCGAIYVLTD
ncbi:MAG: zinc-finger domain-containing protein [Pseudomonadota bacterium]